MHNCAWRAQTLVVARNLALPPLRGGVRGEKGLRGGTERLKDAERLSRAGDVGLTLRIKLHGRGPRAEADAACRLR